MVSGRLTRTIGKKRPARIIPKPGSDLKTTIKPLKSIFLLGLAALVSQRVWLQVPEFRGLAMRESSLPVLPMFRPSRVRP